MVSRVLLAILCLAATGARADEAARRFGAREAVGLVSLSPDGDSIAVIAPTPGRGSVVLIGHPDQPGLKPILKSTGSPDQLSYCRWSTNTRLVCGIFMSVNNGLDDIGYTRLVSLNADGSDLQMLSARASARAMRNVQDGGSPIDWMGDDSGSGRVLMTRSFVPEVATGSLIGSSRAGLGVDLVDTTTLARRTVEQPNGVATEYITDGHGQVRIRGLRERLSTGYDGDTISYGYRRAGSRDWAPLSKLSLAGGGGFNPYAVDRDLNVAYGFDTLDGRQALYTATATPMSASASRD